jgi:hypothetical protein
MIRASRVEPVWHGVRGCEQAQEVAQRDSNPSGAHAQLMPQLVDGLLEQEDIEQNLPVLLRRWYEMRMNGPQVSAQKRRRSPYLPVSRPGLRVRIGCPNRPCSMFGLVPVGGSGGIGERAQHGGHVPHRRPLEPALGQGVIWLSLEIDYRDVVAGDQDLAQVIVAVAADGGRQDPTAARDACQSGVRATDTGAEPGPWS